VAFGSSVARATESVGYQVIREVRAGWWHEDCPPWMTEMFGDDAPWHFWTPEIIRRIAGTATCAMPPLTEDLEAPLALCVNAWGPLLPLLHFHLGWQRIDHGLARWAALGFDTFDDPTLTAIVEQWGRALPTAVRWSVSDGHSYHTDDETVPPSLPPMDTSWRGPGPDGLHLDSHQTLRHAGNHWNAAYLLPEAGDRATDLHVEKRRIGDGHFALILPTYLGWYRALEEIGNGFSLLPTGRSWRFDITIARIGFLGTFRRSRMSGRWFTGRHKAHSLGLDPAHHH